MFTVQNCSESLYTGFLGGEVPEVSRSPNNPATLVQTGEGTPGEAGCKSGCETFGNRNAEGS